MECVASFVLLSKLFEVLRYQSLLNVHLWPVITYLVCSYLLDSFYSFLVYCFFCKNTRNFRCGDYIKEPSSVVCRKSLQTV